MAIKKVIQISDLHIPNDDKKRPFDKMLDSFFNQLIENEFDGIKEDGDYWRDDYRIVICGDIFEDKIRASNEARNLFHEFLNKCSNLCGTLVIAGNHDLLTNNKDRIDSITPTFQVLNAYEGIVRYLDKDLNYKSGYLYDDNVIWNLFSIFDNFADTGVTKDLKENEDVKIIGLFHGDIVGAVTDSGYTSKHGVDNSVFSECDCVMAGHIHKHQEIIANGVPVVYGGSLFQHDAGENINRHGYVVWDIDTMEYELKEVDNDYRIFKFVINDFDDFKNDNVTLKNVY